MAKGKVFDLGRIRLSGNQSLARGAIEAGVRVATGYPGAPISDLQMSFEQLAGNISKTNAFTVNVGKIVNTHGVKGEIRVVSRTDFPEERYKVGNTLYISNEKGGEPFPVKITSHRQHKTFDLLTFEGYGNVNEVEQFKGSLLKVPEDQLGELAEGEYYYHEIIGCNVVTEEGEALGTIKEVLSPGANDVWVIKRPKGQDLLIPYIDDVVLQVNIENKLVTIHVMEGLL